jgi:hypothetical protein
MNRNTFARLALLIGALAVLLVLQGCGGDDGVSQSLHDSVSADLGAAESRVAELEGMIGAMDDPAADSLRGMLAQAMTDLTAAQTALMTAQGDLTTAQGDLTTAQGDLTTAQGDLTTEKAEVTRLMTEVTRLTTALTTAVNERDMYKEMVEDVGAMEMADDMRADMDQRAMSLLTAMMVQEDASEPTVEVEWDDSAMVTVKDQPDFTAGDATPAITGWTNVTLEEDRALPVGGTDSVYVYTDIGGPTETTFEKAHGDDTGLVTLSGTTSNGDAMLAMADRFPGDGFDYDHWNVDPDGDVTTTEGAAKADIPGFYDEVPGTFECGATASDECTIMGVEDADGNLVLTFGGGMVWTFTPADATDTVMVDDADFLTFGYWLYKPVESEDEHLFSAFQMGSMPYDDDDDDADTLNLNGLTGKATYRGNAGGKYVTRDTIAKTANIGLFTAKAKLDAAFGGANEPGTITGTISDFMSGGQELTGWEVTLGLSGAAGSNITDGVPTGVVNGTIGGVTIARPDDADLAASGNNWRAEFYGAMDARADMQPGSVAGTFDLHGGNETLVSVSGAFGAHNVSPENVSPEN